jgi:hypothetical protein
MAGALERLKEGQREPVGCVRSARGPLSRSIGVQLGARLLPAAHGSEVIFGPVRIDSHRRAA